MNYLTEKTFCCSLDRVTECFLVEIVFWDLKRRFLHKMILKRVGNKAKYTLAALAVVCVCVILVIVSVNKKDMNEDLKVFEYTALGDSIPNGYTVSEDDKLKNYPRLLADDMEKEGEISVNLSEYTKNGITVNGLYEKYLLDGKVQGDLKKADLITVTIGANDVLRKFRELYQEVFDADMKVQDIQTILEIIQKESVNNPQILAEVSEIIGRWDCDDFEKDWKIAMESIRQNQNEGAEVIVTTIYNPVGELEAFGVLNQVIARMIDRMNQIIVNYSKVYGYRAANVSGVGTNEYLQSDGLHPNQQGQQMIMEIIMEQYYGK